EDQELQGPEEEWNVAEPNHSNGHEAAHDDHWDDPECSDPTEHAMQVHPARRHEDVLQEVDRDPAHEEEGMEVDSDRSSERRAAHRVLKRKSGDDRDRHHD